MNQAQNKTETELKAIGRESFSGVLLTDRQFDNAWDLTHGLERQIQGTGTFADWRNDHANAFARSEPLNPVKATAIINDLFKVRTGLSPNEMREALQANEDKLFDRKNNPAIAEKQQAYNAAVDAGARVQHGQRIKFHRAQAEQASKLADNLNITDVGAKKLMGEAFQEIDNRKLSEWGSELNKQYYEPQIEALRKNGQTKSTSDTAKNYSRTQQQSHS